MKKEKILFREWVVCLISILWVILLFFSPGSRLQKFSQEKEKMEARPLKIKITISGAVLYPGIYEVPAGTPVKKILSKAKFLPSADKKFIYPKKIVLNSCEISVPEKKTKKRGAKKQAFR